MAGTHQALTTAPAAPTRRGNRAGRLAHQALIAQKTAEHRRLLWRVRVFLVAVALVSGLGAIASGFDDALGAACVMSLFLLVFSVGFSDSVHRPSRDEYRVLPGAVDAGGEHVCIACGHPGLRHRTVHKTAIVLTDCSRCEHPLWASLGDDASAPAVPAAQH